MGLDITSTHDDLGRVVALAGELDIYTVPEFRSALDSPEAGSGRLVIDLTGVTLLDSSGLGVLVSMLNRTRSGEGELGLVCPQRHIRRVFEITGLRRAFVFGDSVEAVRATLDEVATKRAS